MGRLPEASLGDTSATRPPCLPLCSTHAESMWDALGTKVVGHTWEGRVTEAIPRPPGRKGHLKPSPAKQNWPRKAVVQWWLLLRLLRGGATGYPVVHHGRHLKRTTSGRIVLVFQWLRLNGFVSGTRLQIPQFSVQFTACTTGCCKLRFVHRSQTLRAQLQLHCCPILLYRVQQQALSESGMR